MSSTPNFNSPFKNQFKDPNNFEADSFEVRSKVEESNTLSKISDRARKDKKIAKNLDKKSKQFHRKLAGTERVYVRRTRSSRNFSGIEKNLKDGASLRKVK